MGNVLRLVKCQVKKWEIVKSDVFGNLKNEGKYWRVYGGV